MDWLSIRHTVIDCEHKKVTFQLPNQESFSFQGKWVVSPSYLVSEIKVCQLLRNGCQGFLCSILESRNVGVKLVDILVVRKFFDVFLNDFPSDLLRGRLNLE